MKDKGPTDNAIRGFVDSYDEVKRHKKVNKRNRHKVKAAIKKLLREGEEKDDFSEDRDAH
jgi:hypothetical protein